jgi:hypothetical protein
MRRTALLLCALGALVGASSAQAAIETETTGRVCCPHVAGTLEQFAGYYFKGKTTPSLRGQYVYFQYKRPWWERWHRFKTEADGAGLGFYVLYGDEPRDQINRRHRWRILFTPTVRPGRWKLRAVFRAQDGYARSVEVERYRVRASD